MAQSHRAMGGKPGAPGLDFETWETTNLNGQAVPPTPLITGTSHLEETWNTSTQEIGHPNRRIQRPGAPFMAQSHRAMGGKRDSNPQSIETLPPGLNQQRAHRNCVSPDPHQAQHGNPYPDSRVPQVSILRPGRPRISMGRWSPTPLITGTSNLEETWNISTQEIGHPNRRIQRPGAPFMAQSHRAMGGKPRTPIRSLSRPCHPACTSNERIETAFHLTPIRHNTAIPIPTASSRRAAGRSRPKAAASFARAAAPP